MFDRLSVNPDGLQAGSRALAEHAGQLVGAHGAVPAGTKSSTAGAASFAASIDAFTRAYADRMARHGESIGKAAGEYVATDDGEAADISAVST